MWVDGHEIAYLESGSGPPLVLLHGLGHSSTAWLRTLPLFAAKHHAFAPDFPGHGRSPVARRKPDPAFYASIVEGFVTALAAGPVDAIGNSFGGLALLLAALDRPVLFRRLVLTDPAGFTLAPRPPLDDAVLALVGLWLSLPPTRALVRTGYAAAFYDSKQIDEASVEGAMQRRSNPELVRAGRETLHEVVRFSRDLGEFHRRLTNLPHPILLVWGKKDPILPARDAEVAQRVLPHVRTVLVERCGHLPHVERPAEFAHLVMEFLGSA